MKRETNKAQKFLKFNKKKFPLASAGTPREIVTEAMAFERYCPTRWIWLKTDSFENVLLKGRGAGNFLKFRPPPIRWEPFKVLEHHLVFWWAIWKPMGMAAMKINAFVNAFIDYRHNNLHNFKVKKVNSPSPTPLSQFAQACNIYWYMLHREKFREHRLTERQRSCFFKIYLTSIVRH